MNYPFRQWAFGPCFYCGQHTYRTGMKPAPPWMYTRDHIVPRIRLRKAKACLGITVTCCYQCNHLKGGLAVRKFISKYINPLRQQHLDWKSIRLAENRAGGLRR